MISHVREVWKRRIPRDGAIQNGYTSSLASVRGLEEACLIATCPEPVEGWSAVADARTLAFVLQLRELKAGTGGGHMMAQTALKYDVQVKADGRVELEVPFPAGASVTVFVIEAGDTFHDLLAASESSLDFWNNPFDDEDWDNAPVG